MTMDTKIGVKYALRTKSIINRIESEKNREKPRCREPKEKQKPAPLSKYRRKTANTRERNRMKEINDAFVMLQKAIPHLSGIDAEKLTKITVLRLAVNYINVLAGVLNGDTCNFAHMDVDDVRELWSIENAHIIKHEHNVTSVIRTNTNNKVEVSQVNKVSKNKCSVNTKVPNKPVKQIKCSHSCSTIKKSNHVKTKNTVSVKPVTTTRRPNKSKSKTKVCRTASVATNNGAFMTFKNVAIQTPPHRVGDHVNNQPLMMSMTVKRPRLESSYMGPREAKQPRLEQSSAPINTVPQGHRQHLVALTCCSPNSVQSQCSIPEPLVGATPYNPCHLPNTSCISIPQRTMTNYHNNTTILQDPDIPLLKNNNLLEFSRCTDQQISNALCSASCLSNGSAPSSPLSCATHTSVPVGDSSPVFSVASSALCSDSSCLSDGSAPSSPLSGATHTTVPVGDISPVFSVASSDFFGCVSGSDSDSVLSIPMELESLLGDEPFKEELDNLASAFAEHDDTLDLLFRHSTADFIHRY